MGGGPGRGPPLSRGGDKDNTQLNPGVSITALVPYNIPAGDAITRLDLHDSEFSGGVTVRL